MNLSLGPDEIAIIDSARDALAHELPIAKGRSGLSALAQEQQGIALAASLGWLGIGCSEDVGGAGGSIIEEVLLACELGRGVAPLPLLSGLIAARLAEAAGAPEEAAAIISGSQKVALVQSDKWALAGSGASLFLKVDDVGARLFRASNTEAELASFDPTMTVTLYPDCTCIVSLTGRSWFLELQLLIAAAQTGLAEAALASSLEHAKLREQFGQPIGAFQAVRHKCSDMVLRCARARAQMLFAAVALRDGRDQAERDVLAAAIVAHEAANANARTNIFIHGAQGVTAEHSAHLFLKRSISMSGAVESMAALRDILSGFAQNVEEVMHAG